MKRILLVISVLTLCLGLFAACEKSTPDPTTDTNGNQQSDTQQTDSQKETEDKSSSSDKQKITVWAWDPNFNIAIMNEAAAIYQETHDNVEFEIVEMAKADVEQKLHTTLASKMTEGLPDIVLIEDYNSQKYLQSYPGAFADLTDKINYDDFAPYKVELMTVDSRVYGVPFDSGVSGFFYRSDILEEAGYSADDLNNITWDRLIEIGKDVKAKTGKAILSFDKADGGLMRIMLNSSGLWYFDAEGNITVSNNEALKEAMETYKKILDADIIIPTAGWNEWVAAFNNGDAASVISGCWIVGSVKAATDQSGKWAAAPVPRLNYDKSINASNLGGSSWYILEGAQNKDLAIDFMNEVFGGNVDFYQKILVNNGAVASYLPAIEGSAYSAADEFFGGQAVFADMGKWMNEIPSINYGLYTYEADAAIIANLENYLSGAKTVEEALQDAEAQLKSQIQ
ncbi:MAG: extracellular solute-binding protein [Clostridiales bacterium]|nr:extracellular solute-binding protein [Clostridiales bacterium]